MAAWLACGETTPQTSLPLGNLFAFTWLVSKVFDRVYLVVRNRLGENQVP